MPGVRTQRDIRPLCFDHHSEMHFNIGINPAEPPAFVCTVADCRIGYTDSAGYFYAPDVIPTDKETLPGVICPNDGLLMYLAEVRAEDQSLRLWRCPRCAQSRTNRDQPPGGKVARARQ